MLGLAMPANVVQMLLGGVVLGIVVLMLVTKKSEFPQVAQPDALSQALALNGVFVDGASRPRVQLAGAPHACRAWSSSWASACWPACSASAPAGPTCRRSTC